MQKVNIEEYLSQIFTLDFAMNARNEKRPFAEEILLHRKRFFLKGFFYRFSQKWSSRKNELKKIAHIQWS
jgi:hypothetical protein